MQKRVDRQYLRRSLVGVAVAGALSLNSIARSEARPLPSYLNCLDARSIFTYIEGNITQVREDGFDVRQANGRMASVQTDHTHSGVAVGRGYRVRVYGEWRNDLFLARTIQVLEDGNGPPVGRPNPATTWIGTIDDVKSQTRFKLRDEQGRKFTVDSRRRLPELREGWRVRIHGTQRGGKIEADSVAVVDEGGIGGDGDGSGQAETGQRVDFDATVYQRLSERRLRVRANNGTPSEVETDFDVGNIQVNDRVHIQGRLNGNVITAQRVTRMGTVPNRPNTQSRFTLVGTVLSVDEKARQLVVQDESGAVYSVQYASARNFQRSQRVTVTGRLRPNNSIIAKSVSLQTAKR